jgi:hypothetical protein
MHEKAFWYAIRDSDYAVPGDYVIDELTVELNDYLGSPDNELRDDIAYNTLGSWIIAGKYSNDQLRDLLAKWSGNLAVGIGEQETESVLLRSFSALMLSILVYRDWKEPYLTEAEMETLLNTVLNYFANERDIRGFDEKLGWLHSAAHTADILKFFARNPKSSVSQHQRIMDAIADKITVKQAHIYNNGEDERMVLAVLDVLKRGTLEEAATTAWLDRFIAVADAVKAAQSDGFQPDMHGMYKNTKEFLRSLYFALVYQDEPIQGAHDLSEQTFEALKKFRS